MLKGPDNKKATKNVWPNSPAELYTVGQVADTMKALLGQGCDPDEMGTIPNCSQCPARQRCTSLGVPVTDALADRSQQTFK